jgi:hypothetical protein
MSDADIASGFFDDGKVTGQTYRNQTMPTATDQESPQKMAERKAWEKAHGFAQGGMPSMYLPYGYQVGGMPPMPLPADPSLAPLNQPSIYDMPLDQVAQQKAYLPTPTKQQGGQSDNDEDDFEYMDERQIAAFMAAGGVIKYVD